MFKPAGVVRRLDALGRVVLPSSLRKRYNMNIGAEIEIYVDGDRVVLERYKPRCLFCGDQEHVQEVKGKHVCQLCLAEMTIGHKESAATKPSQQN